MLVWAHPTQDDDRDRGGAYNPATDTWTLLPPSGAIPRDNPAAAWTGEALVLWGGLVFSGSESAEEPSDGLVYTPA